MMWRRGQAYGQDLRDRVLASSGASLREVAERLSVSPSYVSKVWARLRETGEREARPQRNQVPLRLVPMLSALRTRTGATPDATLAELRAWAEAEHGVRVSHQVMWKVLTRLGLTLKKSGSAPPSRTAPMSPRPVGAGPRPLQVSIRTAWYSSTRPGRPRT
jgi:transposase